MESGLVKTPSFTLLREAHPSRENIDSRAGGQAETHAGVQAETRPGGQPEKRGKRAEYLLVICPGGELQEKLMREQEQFAADYDLHVKVRNKPHVTLAAFQAGEIMEDMLIRWIQRISNCYTSFDLTLNNYSGFPPYPADRSEAAPGIIYLRVQDPRPFRMLMQQLRAIDEFIRSSGCPPAHLFTRPFLTIAGGLTEQVYNKALPDFSRRTFHDTFHVGELVLLKRTHAFDACRTVNIFRLRQPEAEPLSRWPLPHI